MSDNALFMPIFQSIDSSWTCEQAVGHHLFMEPANIPVGIPGRDLIVQWFGEWPTFHDAEVIGLTLVRSGNSVLQLYPYYPAKPQR